ncbi:hypothetical protein KP509_32G011500 [Ceratopteris richardii]|uniref:Peptidase S54 rhomboid domain-containing protein n=1 Tax=Ceratopteris richardii TaxID=49495 RepID=A0A8T2QRE7_CERRI|nr:hypothetical protein KP509_32G011500 [Ceratopteris richardii]
MRKSLVFPASRTFQTLWLRNGNFSCWKVVSQTRYHSDAGRRSHIVFSMPFHFVHDLQGALPKGFTALGSRMQLLMEPRRNPCMSGLQAIHSIVYPDYFGLRCGRHNATKIVGYKFNAASMSNYRCLSGDTALSFLVGANLTVFLMWYQLDNSFMIKHFVLSYDNLFVRGNLHTAITTAFSHMSLKHLLFNLVGLCFFGHHIGTEFGGTNLIFIYLMGALNGSIGHLLYHMLFYPYLKGFHINPRAWMKIPGAIGASGAITTLTFLSILTDPGRMVIVGFVPMPATVAGGVIFGIDLYQIYRVYHWFMPFHQYFFLHVS